MMVFSVRCNRVFYKFPGRFLLWTTTVVHDNSWLYSRCKSPGTALSDHLLDECPDVPVKIEENFIAFLPVEETSGKELTTVVLQELKNLQLLSKNINFVVKDMTMGLIWKVINLVFRQDFETNPWAFFTPCTCHNPNLLLSDMTKSSVKGTTFFGILAWLYAFLSGSTKRWSIFKQHISTLTVKPLCETRWEAVFRVLLYCDIRKVKYMLPYLTYQRTWMMHKLAVEQSYSLKQYWTFPSLFSSVLVWHTTLCQ